MSHLRPLLLHEQFDRRSGLCKEESRPIFFVDLPVAVVTATVVSTVSCSIQWYESRAISARAVSRRLILSALVGMPFGLWLLNNLDPRLMKGLLGIFVFIGVFLSSREFDLRRLPLAFDYSMGVIAGVLSTSTSTNGPPLVFLLHARHYSPEHFRAVLIGRPLLQYH